MGFSSRKIRNAARGERLNRAALMALRVVCPTQIVCEYRVSFSAALPAPHVVPPQPFGPVMIM